MPKNAWVTGATLSDSDRTGRFGVLYMRALVAQAGWGSTETSPGEDHKGIDVALDFTEGAVHVQVKCGTKAPSKGGWYTIPVEAQWVTKWNASKTPVYLVYVPVVLDPARWVSHNGSSTQLTARAFWVRVDQSPSSGSVRVPIQNRLVADTLALWRNDFNNAFGGGQP